MALNRAKLLESADKLVRQGKLEEAIKQYATLSEDNPRDVNTINRIGDLYVRLRKNKEAIRQFMRIADFYAGDGFHLKAIAMYKKITKLDPSNTDANERLAGLYAKQGLVIEARTQFLSLAEQCLKAGQKPKAIEIFQKVQALEPDNLKVRVILADLLGKEGDPGKAADGFISAAADVRKRGMGDEALKLLLKAVRLQPGRRIPGKPWPFWSRCTRRTRP
jgi:tetratricopeptide (TPR) repeat protein